MAKNREKQRFKKVVEVFGNCVSKKQWKIVEFASTLTFQNNSFGTLMYICNRVGTPVCGEVYEVFSCMKIFGTIHYVV